MRWLVTGVLAVVILLSTEAQSVLSSEAKALFDKFFVLRMNLSLCQNNEAALEEINRFPVENAEVAKLDEQGQLILENLIILERYNYLYEIEGEKKEQRRILGEQRKKCEEFEKGNPSELSAWFYVTYGDVTSCYMGFTASDLLKYGAKVRPMYEKALVQDGEQSYILTNIAQWYYWAPGFIGGSKKKALAYFEKAHVSAKTKAQKYFADIFLSQMLYDNKEFGRCEELLASAETQCPGSRYIKKIRLANYNGMSIFQYSRKKSALDSESI